MDTFYAVRSTEDEQIECQAMLWIHVNRKSRKIQSINEIHPSQVIIQQRESSQSK